MTNLKKSKTAVNVGVDVGKSFRDENTPSGIARILKRLTYYHIERIVMEATGRYEFALAEACYLKGLPVCIL